MSPSLLQYPDDPLRQQGFDAATKEAKPIILNLPPATIETIRSKASLAGVSMSEWITQLVKEQTS